MVSDAGRLGKSAAARPVRRHSCEPGCRVATRGVHMVVTAAAELHCKHLKVPAGEAHPY